jgi:TolB-like protein
MLRLKLFGSFELTGPKGRVAFPSAKLTAFLAFLALSPKPVLRDQLTSLLWGSRFEDQARQNFRQALTRLRKVIGPDALVGDDQSLQLLRTQFVSDAGEFEALMKTGTAESLRCAVAILDGDLLSGLDVHEPLWEEWLSNERRRFGTLACDSLERLGRMEIEEGRPLEALRNAEECIRRDIFREDAHRLAIRAFAELGRRSEALKHYQNFAERLKQELGTSPEAATVALYEQARQATGTKEEAPPSTSAAMARKPSLAVLPFANLSNEPEQDYFIDGMVDEIITALSRLHWLFVIARSSSFTYKGRTVDVKQVGRELGVRYVLEGSVRKAGNRLRISGQLVDAVSGTALWADRIEGELADIFELQDQVTWQVVGAIAPKLEQAEIERSRRKTGNLDAYDYYLRGQAEVLKWTKEANRLALAYFTRATELDPDFSTAYGMAARCYSQAKAQGWISDSAFESAEVRRLARIAVELGPDDPIALCASGMALAFVACDLDAGDVLIDKSLRLNPNLAMAWTFSGFLKSWKGEADLAISHASRAILLSPHDPNLSNMRRAIAFAYFVAGRYEEAISASEMATPVPQNIIFAVATVAASAALLGRKEEAERAMGLMRQQDSRIRCSHLKERFPLKRKEDQMRWEEGLRKAGLPK